MTMTIGRRLGGAALLFGVTVAGCGDPDGSPAGADPSEHSAADGDCVARVLYEDETYFPRETRVRGATEQRPLGDAAIVGCHEEPTGLRVVVFPVPGITSSEALVVTEGEYRSLYVREDLPGDDWSTALRQLADPPE
jgi:hypothetical protein